MTAFSRELYQAPRSRAGRAYSDLIYAFDVVIASMLYGLCPDTGHNRGVIMEKRSGIDAER